MQQRTKFQNNLAKYKLVFDLHEVFIPKGFIIKLIK